MKAGSIEQFKHLSQFRDIRDFNNQIEQWMIDLKSKFTKSELIALKRIIRFSAKIAGVCNAKIQTLVSACHEAGHEISRSTFERMLRKAKKFGLLIVYNTKKENGKQAHNVYVFQRYTSISSTNDVAENAKIDGAENYHSSFETNNNINKRTENVETEDTLDASYTSSRVPVQFRDFVRCFWNDFTIIEELWKVIQIQTYYYTYMTLEEKTQLGISALKQMIRNLKRGRKIINIFGYFYAIVSALLDREAQEAWREMMWEVA
ncbi:hypothetical protein GGR02_003015 [Anoxybacillus voinovskiensis]|uniref:Uncharacterized protein n=1 Tax=Anoxybacteroides voinovskiense TaxID=230470 RepID=A0A840DYZ3_9BACL|nr:hypothetical protein [Anoxybacillus voinovskiensis]MBB4075198.1 hypothetical protein [Anoxybacillus voinovskiensis]GGJ77079.1 hypothetical protein GCM10008982_28030 [Anoxybacillus voinovskiensis]